MRPVSVARLLHRRHYGDKHVDQVDDQGIANGGSDPAASTASTTRKTCSRAFEHMV
jgi:hypothetical protein